MALARVKTWIREKLLSADLNAEFNNILNNALSLISPLTGNLNANNNQITNLVIETVTATPSGTPEGRIVYHTTLDQLQVMDGGSARIVPTLAGVSQGDLIYAATANQFGKLNVGAAGTLVRSSGTVPTWAQAVLTTDVTGILPTANGGTGLATVPVGGLAVGQGAGAMIAVAAATTSGVLYATSASATPSWQQHVTLATVNISTANIATANVTILRLQSGSLAAPAIQFAANSDAGFAYSSGILFVMDGVQILQLNTSGHLLPALTNTYDIGAASQALRAIYAGTLISNAGYYEGTEMATPSAPAGNSGRWFFADNGAGKTQLQVRFPSGAVQVLATEP